jgi:hypothetical protein
MHGSEPCRDGPQEGFSLYTITHTEVSEGNALPHIQALAFGKDRRVGVG